METWIFQLVGTIVQTGVLLAGAFIAIGGATTRLENLDKRIDKLEVAFIQVARQDERLNAMDQRMMAQGRRIDRIDGKTQRREEQE